MTKRTHTISSFLKMPLGILISIVFYSCSFVNSESKAEDPVVSIEMLSPLPKVHYSWPLDEELYATRHKEELFHLVRITHALSLRGETVTAERIYDAVVICMKVNKDNPTIRASLAINFSPWHRRFPRDLPPTDEGKGYRDELSYFSSRMTKIKGWVSAVDDRLNTNVSVSALLLDCERFRVKEGDDGWNEAMRKKLETIDDRAKNIFPYARREWFGRGMRYSHDAGKWVQTEYFTGRETLTSMSCWLYTLPSYDRMLKTLEHTCRLGDEHEVGDVTPWVALASGYRFDPKRKTYWERDWQFSPDASRRIGRLLNYTNPNDAANEKNICRRVKVIVFYPAAYSPGTPAWEQHFIAYVQGANGSSEQ